MPFETLDSVRPGMVFSLPPIRCDHDRVSRYADLANAHHPIHVDENFAKASRFGCRIAHGPLPLGLSLAALGDVFGPALVALMEIRSWAFVRPVLVGSRLGATATVLDVGQAKSDGSGVVEVEVSLVGEDGTLLQRGVVGLLIAGWGTPAVAATAEDRSP